MMAKIMLVFPVIALLGCTDAERQRLGDDAGNECMSGCLSAITNGCDDAIYRQCKTNVVECVRASTDPMSAKLMVEDIVAHYLNLDLRLVGNEYHSYEIAVRRYHNFSDAIALMMRSVTNEEARYEFMLAKWRKYKQLCFAIRPCPRFAGETDIEYRDRKSCIMNLYASYVNETMTLRSYMATRKISRLNLKLQEKLIAEGKDLLEYPSVDEMLRAFR